MRKLLIIFVLFTQNVRSQDVIHFVTLKEISVINYQIFQCSSPSSCKVVATIIPTNLKDSNIYESVLPVVNTWYKVVANMPNRDTFELPLLYNNGGANGPVDNLVTVIYTKAYNNWWHDILIWTVANQQNVKAYMIEKSTNNGKNWTNIKMAIASSRLSYSDTISRSFFSRKPIYRVTPIFIDGTKSAPTRFN